MSAVSELDRAHHPPGRRLSARGVVAGLATVVLALFALGVLTLGVGPRFLPYRAYAIHSGSMSPAIPLGSEVILRPVHATDLRPGDVIAFQKPGGGGEIVTHRIVGVETARGQRRFVTRGDANPVPDAWRIRVQGSGWREVATIPYAGYGVEALRSSLVRLVVLAVLLLWVGTAAMRRIWVPEARRSDRSA